MATFGTSTRLFDGLMYTIVIVGGGLSLSIQPGENLAIVGSSGGGKTTICSLIPRFYDLSGGQAA